MNNEVEQFISDLEGVSAEFAEIIRSVRRLYRKHLPDIEEKIIYGGVGFMWEDVLIGGVYPNKKHVSVVFSRGNELNDQNGYLQGKGKHRRQLRIEQLDELNTLDAEGYIKQNVTNVS